MGVVAVVLPQVRPAACCALDRARDRRREAPGPIGTHYVAVQKWIWNPRALCLRQVEAQALLRLAQVVRCLSPGVSGLSGEQFGNMSLGCKEALRNPHCYQQQCRQTKCAVAAATHAKHALGPGHGSVSRVLQSAYKLTVMSLAGRLWDVCAEGLPRWHGQPWNVCEQKTFADAKD